MNAKIKTIIISILMIITFFPVVNSTLTFNTSETNNEITSKNQEETPCYPCQQQQIFSIIEHPTDRIYPLMDNINIEPDPTKVITKPTILNDLPSEFSWKDYMGKDFTTLPRDQGWCGSCWLFGAISTLESIIEIQENCSELNPDLSEQYVLSCLPSSAAMYGRGCRGGSPPNVFKYILQNNSRGNDVNGIVPESYFKYKGIDASGRDFNNVGFDPVTCDQIVDGWEHYLIPIVNYSTWRPDGSEEDILAIKSQVYESGPVTTCYYVSPGFGAWINTHHDPDDYYPYEYATSTNHCVEIVGWKDDSSIGNGGYWIIKNSWGHYPGYDDGFFNIEYGSLNIDSSQITAVEYDPDMYNWPPQADAGGPYSGSIGEPITFDASNSVDPENDILSYHWDFGDGATATGMTTLHTYETSGIFPITLTITDDIGTTTTDETSTTVDLWTTNDYWTYTFDQFYIYINLSSGMTYIIDGAIENLKISYESETDTTYTLAMEGILDGTFLLEVENLKPGVKIVRNGQISGSLTIEKGSLQMLGYSLTISGTINPKYGILRFPIPLPVSITLSGEFHTPFATYDFPLKEGKTWDSQSNYITTKITTESQTFNILHIINRISGLIGYPLFNPEGGIFDITVKSDRFSCGEYTSITVPKGTYDAYQVNFANLIDFYFSPDISNLVKIHADTNDFSTPYWDLQFSINGELTDTNK